MDEPPPVAATTPSSRPAPHAAAAGAAAPTRARDRIALLAIEAPADPYPTDIVSYARDLLSAGYRVALIHDDPAAVASFAATSDLLIAVRSPARGAFALWRDAMRQLDLPRADTAALLLASTGLCGPFAPLSPILERFDFEACDLWGLTESWIGQYHLPNCFVGYGGRAVRHPAWGEFWDRLPAHSERPQISAQIGIDLTQTLLAAGFFAAAIWPYQRLLDAAGAAFAALRAEHLATEPGKRDALDGTLRARLEHLRRIRTLQANRTPMEPLQFFWQELLDLGAPFVSRELLARNPHGIVTAPQCADRLRTMRVPA